MQAVLATALARASVVRFAIIAVAIFALHVAPDAHAECMELGGLEYCGSPPPVPAWTYSLCDEAAPFTFRVIAWCQVRGGTWNGSTCIGGTPDTEDNMQ